MTKSSFQQASLIIIFIAIVYALFKIDFDLLNRSDLYMVVLFLLTGAIALFKGVKKEREKSDGLPEEDELSELNKYKSSYYAFMCSLYLWMGIYFFRNEFPDIETLLLIGILGPAIILGISRVFVKFRHYGK